MPKKLTSAETEEILTTLQSRFDHNPARHLRMDWQKIEAKLRANPVKIQSLSEMEKSGGEPDVINYDADKDEYSFVDCSAESPAGRRSLCYDRAALDQRKENKPKGNVIEMAEQMGIELLDENQYRQLQQLGKFDLKTSSWIKTPESIRTLGGSIFADLRYETIFIYHNGASSYYASRGFRGILKV